MTKRNAYFIKAYQTIVDAVPEFGNEYSLLEFIETKLLFNSRTYFLDYDDDDQSIGAVPWADSYNHGTGTSWRYKIKDDGRRGFFFTAKEDIEKGEEIYLSYGYSKTNADFL